MKHVGQIGAAILVAATSLLAQQNSVTIQAKSFIARMVTAKSEKDGAPDAPTNKALGFDNLVGGRVQAYELMLLTDKNFRENPLDGTIESQQFRLRSEIQVTGKCRVGKITEWRVTAPQIGFGKEGPLESVGEMLTQLSVIPAMNGTGPRTSIRFHYAVKGRPHALTSALFENIRPRVCYWIWHEVTGVASCSGDTLVVKSDIAGSTFPTHRLWQDGKLVAQRPQGPFESLWNCSSIAGLVK